MDAIWLAVLHMRYHWMRTTLLVGCLTISLLLPLVLRQLAPKIQAELHRRAKQTPLVIGSVGSPLDLTLHGLYFRASDLQTLKFGNWQEFQRKGFEAAVPLHVRFQVDRIPIVGTHLEYFQFRKLKLASGEVFGRLGDCVLGAKAADELGLNVGDQVISNPKSFLSIAADYPLRMNVVGVLEYVDSPDDLAVFVDVKTAWVIENLGHGHQDVIGSEDPNLVLEKNEQGTVASAAVLPFTEITDQSIASFHFHGDQSEFPLTAILILSEEQKVQDLAAGFASKLPGLQAVLADKTVSELISVVFQIQQLILATVIFVALATFSLFGLVIGLSLHIRKDEMETMFKLGASRGFTFSMLAAEVSLILVLAMGSSFLLSHFLTDLLGESLYRWLA